MLGGGGGICTGAKRTGGTCIMAGSGGICMGGGGRTGGRGWMTVGSSWRFEFEPKASLSANPCLDMSNLCCLRISSSRSRRSSSSRLCWSCCSARCSFLQRLPICCICCHHLSSRCRTASIVGCGCCRGGCIGGWAACWTGS